MGRKSVSLEDLKTQARTAAYERRRVAHAAGHDPTANRHLAEHICETPGVRIVSAYMPIRTELSPLCTMIELVERGFRVCVPVIVGKAQPLEFHEWRPDTAMADGPFGAMVPVDSEILEPDLVVTPLLAYNAAGFRLGYGGGFYDRTFARLRAAGKGIGVGLAYSAQEDPELPVEATDAKLHTLITENGVTSFEM